MKERLWEAWKCINDHGKHANNWYLAKWRWWGLSIKAAICVLLGWEGGKPDAHQRWLPDEKRYSVANHQDVEEITYLSSTEYQHHEFGRAGHFTEIDVARGWRVWHYHYIEDGWP